MLLCAGEALIDMLPRESAGGEPCFAPVAGGSVFNTAIAAARLGTPTAFFSGLSTDLFGRRLVAALEESGVDHAPACRSARPTTLAFVDLTEGQARYAFYDENTAGRMLDVADLPDDPGGVTALFLGGISLVPEPCASTYAALALREAPRRLVMLDPNIRPGFVADEAAYRARLERMIGATDIVKVSDADLHWLAGPGDPTDLARRLLDRGPRIVCVTAGDKGVTAHTTSGHLAVPARPAAVVDTVGAGDTFNAGLLAGLDRHGALHKAWMDNIDEDVLEEALELGVAAAAVTVARAGANPPWAREL